MQKLQVPKLEKPDPIDRISERTPPEGYAGLIRSVKEAVSSFNRAVPTHFRKLADRKPGTDN